MRQSGTTVNTVSKLILRLKKNYPEAHCYLNFESPYQLLVATTLSAQCTDERVNQVTKVLFKKAPNPKAMSKLTLSEIEELIFSTGFYKNKAKSLKACAEELLENYGSEVPQTMEALIKLPGVGRKTANVVLGNAFGCPDGVVVDTHVGRISQRFGLSKNKTPEKIEQDLNLIIPKSEWTQFSHLLIAHGRAICESRRPKCEDCFLLDLCSQRGV